jgi:hypothetical protein
VPIHMMPALSLTMSLKRGEPMAGVSSVEMARQVSPSKWAMPPASQNGA